MTPSRYEELLCALLDGELSTEEADELAAGLRTQPDLLRDLARHLVLWEVWSQHAAPERSAEAFVAAWRTRLRAESEGTDAFPAGVLARVEAGGGEDLSRGRARSERPRGRASGWLAALGAAIRRPVGIAWTAALACAGLIGLLWLAGSHQARAMVAIQGEAVCTACTLHESHDHKPAIRVTAGGATHIYYLDSTPAVAGMQDRFCSGPTPAAADGAVRTEAGRLRMAADDVTFPAPPPPPATDQRILFPI